MRCYPYEGGVEEIEQSSLTQRVIPRIRTRKKEGDRRAQTSQASAVPIPSYDQLVNTCYCPGETMYEEIKNV